MASGDIVSWAAAQVKELLPGLDAEPLREAVKYSLSLSQDDADRHWRSLLGSTPPVESFIKQLRERRQETNESSTIHSPTPRRRTVPSISSSNAKGISSAENSRTPSPSKVLRITSNPPRKKGPGKMTSDLGKPKPKPPPVNPLAQAIEENRPLTELEEIDSAIQSITTTTKNRVECGCYGTKHEVFPLAPNCLTCGRIICVAEGIGDCFYCGEKLVSESQREELMKELRLERGVAKTKAANEKVRKAKAGEARHRAWATKVGGQEWTGHESGGDSDSPFGSGHLTPLDQGNAYLEAERKRDELLEFDRTFAERTKIIDQQAEFMPHATLQEAYSTPQERAAALRRVQQLEAEQAAAERARSRRMLDIDLRTGKGILRGADAEDFVPSPPPVPITNDPTKRAAGGKTEIVNQLGTPTFIEQDA